MILLHNAIEILYLTDLDARLMFTIMAVKRCFVGPLCQGSCRLNRFETFGARIAESGTIRTSVQRSDSGEAEALLHGSAYRTQQPQPI